MKQSITQELDYGCGVACFAFICNITFKQAVAYLGKEYSVKHGWRPSDLVAALNDRGLKYNNNYIRKKAVASYTNGTIVLVERSSDYPAGHYLTYYNGLWMDPWINLGEDNDIELAQSGFRKELPGKAMYALIPVLQ